MRNKTNAAAVITARLIWSVVLLVGQIGMAQETRQTRGESLPIKEPMQSFHGSRGKFDQGKGDTEVLAREMADALVGRIEQPVMTPTRSSFLAKWESVSNATGYRL